MEITKAVYEDLPQILDLQKTAFQSEAELLNDYTIQPLTQTLEELQEEFPKFDKSGVILKLTDEHSRIIGSVRAYQKDSRVHVGKLIVHPDYRNKGYGIKLMEALETYFKDKTFELFTSSKSERNLHLYKKIGYKEFKQQKVSEEYSMIFLEK